MKKNILYAAAAGICGAVLLGGGILIGKSLQPPPEKPVELELLFDLDGMRTAAECVTDFCLQKAMLQQEMNLCASVAAEIKRAELFCAFRAYLASLPEAERKAAIVDQNEWQKRYLEEIAKPSPYEGGSMAPMERGLFAMNRAADRIAWLTVSPETRAVYERMKNLSFTGPDRVVRKLTDGEMTGKFRDGDQELFKLLPEFCTAEGDWTAGLLICNIPGRESCRMIGVWKNGVMKERIRVSKITRVDSLRFRDGKLFVAHTAPDGKRGAMNITLD